MCRNLVLLAQNNRQQMVFTCEHGTIHITHQKTTICLAYEEFRQFAHTLIESGLERLNQSQLGCVRAGADQQVELWIDSSGLRLRPDEFFALTDLLRAALLQLDRLPRPALRPTKRSYSLN